MHYSKLADHTLFHGSKTNHRAAEYLKKLEQKPLIKRQIIFIGFRSLNVAFFAGVSSQFKMMLVLCPFWFWSKNGAIGFGLCGDGL